MGTPYFAKEVLETLYKHEDFEIVLVVTQPDRLVGRKKQVVFSEVKQFVLENNLTYSQPHQVKDIIEKIDALNPDAIITCAYGQFLPKGILKHGVYNFHASLLPKYRGGAPMQYAIKEGESQTGMTLMKSVLKMDAGDIYVQKSVDITLDDTLETVTEKLIEISRDIINNDLLYVINQEIEPVKQDERQVSFAPTISSKEEEIDWSKSGLEIYNHMRSLIPNPAAYSWINKKRIKFYNVSFKEAKHSYPSGLILFQEKEYFDIAVTGGFISVYECQLEGKQKTTVSQLYNGYHKNWHKEQLSHEN